MQLFATDINIISSILVPVQNASQNGDQEEKQTADPQDVIRRLHSTSHC